MVQVLRDLGEQMDLSGTDLREIWVSRWICQVQI